MTISYQTTSTNKKQQLKITHRRNLYQLGQFYAPSPPTGSDLFYVKCIPHGTYYFSYLYYKSLYPDL